MDLELEDLLSDFKQTKESACILRVDASVATEAHLPSDNVHLGLSEEKAATHVVRDTGTVHIPASPLIPHESCNNEGQRIREKIELVDMRIVHDLDDDSKERLFGLLSKGDQALLQEKTNQEHEDTCAGKVKAISETSLVRSLGESNAKTKLMILLGMSEGCTRASASNSCGGAKLLHQRDARSVAAAAFAAENCSVMHDSAGSSAPDPGVPLSRLDTEVDARFDKQLGQCCGEIRSVREEISGKAGAVR